MSKVPVRDVRQPILDSWADELREYIKDMPEKMKENELQWGGKPVKDIEDQGMWNLLLRYVATSWAISNDWQQRVASELTPEEKENVDKHDEAFLDWGLVLLRYILDLEEGKVKVPLPKRKCQQEEDKTRETVVTDIEMAKVEVEEAKLHAVNLNKQLAELRTKLNVERKEMTEKVAKLEAQVEAFKQLAVEQIVDKVIRTKTQRNAKPRKIRANPSIPEEAQMDTQPNPAVEENESGPMSILGLPNTYPDEQRSEPSDSEDDYVPVRRNRRKSFAQAARQPPKVQPRAQIPIPPVSLEKQNIVVRGILERKGKDYGRENSCPKGKTSMQN